MYVPQTFRVDDVQKLIGFMTDYSFATLVTFDGNSPFASHLPVLCRVTEGGQIVLRAHMARANPQWQHFEGGREVLAIFHGPHTYVSPTMYQTQPAVPTWNYAAVHAYGVARIITDHDTILALLQEMVTKYESDRPSPWNGEMPGEFRDKLVQGIVAFEVLVARVEGKFKLSQNRSTADASGVYHDLKDSTSAEGRAVADLMLAEGIVSAS